MPPIMAWCHPAGAGICPFSLSLKAPRRSRTLAAELSECRSAAICPAHLIARGTPPEAIKIFWKYCSSAGFWLYPSRSSSPPKSKAASSGTHLRHGLCDRAKFLIRATCDKDLCWIRYFQAQKIKDSNIGYVFQVVNHEETWIFPDESIPAIGRHLKMCSPESADAPHPTATGLIVSHSRFLSQMKREPWPLCRVSYSGSCHFEKPVRRDFAVYRGIAAASQCGARVRGSILTRASPTRERGAS
jgi:hypothetical protein